MITDFSCKKTNKKKMAGYTCPFKRKKKKSSGRYSPIFSTASLYLFTQEMAPSVMFDHLAVF